MPETIEPTGRRAFVCMAKGCAPPEGVPFRIFLPQGETKRPACPEHGAISMVRDRNKRWKKARTL